MATQLSIADPNIEDVQSVNIKSDTEKQKQLGACIMAALDMENNFKLYSYRIITAEQFQERQFEIANSLKLVQ